MREDGTDEPEREGGRKEGEKSPLGDALHRMAWKQDRAPGAGELFRARKERPEREKGGEREDAKCPPPSRLLFPPSLLSWGQNR